MMEAEPKPAAAAQEEPAPAPATPLATVTEAEVEELPKAIVRLLLKNKLAHIAGGGEGAEVIVSKDAMVMFAESAFSSTTSRPRSYLPTANDLQLVRSSCELCSIFFAAPDQWKIEGEEVAIEDYFYRLFNSLLGFPLLLDRSSSFQSALRTLILLHKLFAESQRCDRGSWWLGGHSVWERTGEGARQMRDSGTGWCNRDGRCAVWWNAGENTRRRRWQM
ncbi:unnamed protein product [Urochloa humidicola]